MTDKLITTNDLSAPACFALTYAQALVAGKGSARWNAFQATLKKANLSGSDVRAFLAKGLAELREMGIVECSRDGEGDLVPTVLHEEKIQGSGPGPRIILNDLN